MLLQKKNGVIFRGNNKIILAFRKLIVIGNRDKIYAKTWLQKLN